MYFSLGDTDEKKIKDGTGKQKDKLCSWIGRIHTVKMAMLHKEIYTFHCNPYQIVSVIIHRTRKKRKKKKNLCRNTKDSEQTKQCWKRKTELEESGSLISDCTTKIQ